MWNVSFRGARICFGALLCIVMFPDLVCLVDETSPQEPLVPYYGCKNPGDSGDEHIGFATTADATGSRRNK